MPASVVEVSARKLFFPRRRVIARFEQGADWSLAAVEPPAGPRVIVGMHSCDVAALRYLDRVFIDTEPGDALYTAERARTAIVGVLCDEMKPSCHCTDRGLSPDETAGMDVALRRGEGGWHALALTERGGELLPAAEAQAAPPPPARDWPKGNWPVPEPEELMALYDDEFWTEASDICLTCGACTFACPTCSCYLVADEKHAGQGERVTCWDSCQFLSYSRETSGHNPRKTNADRLRNRTLDKFAYRKLKYGVSACVGCGRCVLICPIKRSFPNLGRQLAARAKQRKPAAEVK
ncbi:MAG: 4Fe-4S dicluster domain-containing protein [bacterium]